MRLAILLFTLLLIKAPAHGEDLFSFKFDGKVLTFAVANADPITATVDQNAAANAALKWARQFYGLQDASVEGIEFRAQPTRFWLVRLTGNRGGASATLYAVVLPDGSMVEPTVRELALASSLLEDYRSDL